MSNLMYFKGKIANLFFLQNEEPKCKSGNTTPQKIKIKLIFTFITQRN